MPVSDLRALVKQERHAWITLENIEEFLSTYEEERDRGVVQFRMKKLDEVYDKYCEVRVKIEVLTDDLGVDEGAEDATGEGSTDHVSMAEARQRENEEIFKEFENKYFRLKQQLNSKSVGNSGVVAERQPGVEVCQPSRMKYPELRLPTFSGKLSEWINFRDNFKSLIHDNNQLNMIDKFNYLRTSLKDDALLQINQIQVTAANYNLAWATLESKYENHKLIAQEHMRTIFSIPPMKSESFQGLNHVLTTFRINLQQLEKLGENTNDWSTLLAFMLSQKLDDDTIRHWETHHSSKDIPSYKSMVEFLEKHCAILQSTSARRSSDFKRPFKNPVIHAAVSSNGNCQVCNGGTHSIEQCRRFGKMKVIDRKGIVRKLGLCLNCLRSGHFVMDCSRSTCSKCGQNHHYLLHPYVSPVNQEHTSSQPSSQVLPKRPQAANLPQQQSNQAQNRNTSLPNPQSTQTPSTSSQNARPPPTNTPTIHHTATPSKTHHHSNIALLSTAIVKLGDRHGNTILARALLDNGSQICLMSETLSQRLNFQRLRENLPVKGVGATVSSCTSSYVSCELKFYVLSKITSNLPQQSIDVSSWNLPEGITLADPAFNESGDIDVILGAVIFYDLLLNAQRKLSNSGIILRNTQLGWIVAGGIPETSIVSYSTVASSSVTTEELYEELAKFWELESCHTKSCLSIEESACEAIFEETTTRDPDGKFRVTLPKRKHMLEKLGESKAIAKKRYLSMEKRLNANQEMKVLYTAFMHEYLSMGHMTEVVNDDEESGPEYYVPHHAVLKPDSTTTKLRVVFDASCSTDSGVSLNDVLMVGPVVQDELRSILLRFRLFKYAVVGDAEKMYRMVWQHELDQLLHKIFWRDSVEEPLRTYKLTTVTYGTSSAPYLATRCLNKCAEEGAERYPVASVVVKKSFYVDDMLAGSHTIEEGERLCKEVLELLKGSGFNLRKWNSNNPKILAAIPSHLRDDREFRNLDEKATVKTLGLTWAPATDTLWIKVPDWRPGGPITHRVVLSEIARLFDPYGLVGPVVVQGKLFLQEIWKAKYSWDEPLSNELQSRWLEFRTNLCELDAVSVPRWIRFGRDVISCEFHGFSDASDKAYGAVVYLRCVNRDGEVTVNLLMAKSKVAPLEDLNRRKKKQSTPRLELSAALLLAHLYESIFTSMMIAAKSYFWTDSTIVKCWISSHPSRWQVFVANRVSEIQHVTKGGIWNHVPGIENPADIISRGATPAQIASNTLWWNGPEWLKKETQYWPVNAQVPDQQFDSVILEEKPLVAAVLQILPPSEIFTLRSTLLNLVRLTAWLRRFSFNCKPRNKLQKRFGVVTAAEHEEALLVLVQLAQSECFPLELLDLAAKSEVRPSSKLRNLNPVMIDGTICVGGRLGNASISQRRKHPMILDSRHPLTRLILIDYHHRLLHGGPQLMISCVRERFWPLSVRNLARKVTHECMNCFRAKPRAHEQLMGDLPLERVSPAPPFQRVGIDYCGPFELQPATRKGTPVKCYVCLFVCMVCKAVHVEVVMDLTAEAFLAALRRFVARRGRPDQIYCDNATNFVGARRQLSELDRMFQQQQFQQQLSAEAARDSITFKFIPAKSPNFGGLWEAAVKSLKGHMRKVIGNRMLKQDEMLTVVTQIEACLNSRPLTPLSNDPSDLEVLTPGHFLIQRPLTAVPEPSLLELPEGRLSRWQQVQRYSQVIWKHWSTDYLSNLQSRNKWTRHRNNLDVGAMVLLKEDNIPPLKWKLGRVTEIHPGPDGNVRVVTVNTKHGYFRRAISKICILPIRDNQSDESQ
ncbi:uncharacterized protein LOC135712267 [Ochlerotatus camptorhynchus]|uniref:uncharacterized protein LOC135712267 n=1 Tax=Ochlerotatus camptorhynchus TaxID=644619 RepID=UPI0031CDC26C